MIMDFFNLIKELTGQDPLPSLLLTILVVIALFQLRSQRAMNKTVHSWDVAFNQHKGIMDVQLYRLDENFRRNTDRLNHHHERLNQHEKTIHEHSYIIKEKGLNT